MEKVLGGHVTEHKTSSDFRPPEPGEGDPFQALVAFPFRKELVSTVEVL